MPQFFFLSLIFSTNIKVLVKFLSIDYHCEKSIVIFALFLYNQFIIADRFLA